MTRLTALIELGNETLLDVKGNIVEEGKFEFLYSKDLENPITLSAFYQKFYALAEKALKDKGNKKYTAMIKVE